MEFLSHFTDLGKHAVFIWLSWGAVILALLVLGLTSRASVTRRAKQVDAMKAETRTDESDPT